jgi:hypothetical protein
MRRGIKPRRSTKEIDMSCFGSHDTAGDNPTYKIRSQRDWVFRHEDIRFVPLLNFEALVSTATLGTDIETSKQVSLKLYKDRGSAVSYSIIPEAAYIIAIKVDGLSLFSAAFRFNELSYQYHDGWFRFEKTARELVEEGLQKYTDAAEADIKTTAMKLVKGLKSLYLFENCPELPKPRKGWEGFDGSEFPSVTYTFVGCIAKVCFDTIKRNYEMQITLPTDPVTKIIKIWPTLDEAMIDAEAITQRYVLGDLTYRAQLGIQKWMQGLTWYPTKNNSDK